MQRRSLQSILDAGGSVDDDESIKKNYNWYEVSYDKKDRKLLSFSLDEKKIENVKKTSASSGTSPSALTIPPRRPLTRMASGMNRRSTSVR